MQNDSKNRYYALFFKKYVNNNLTFCFLHIFDTNISRVKNLAVDVILKIRRPV